MTAPTTSASPQVQVTVSFTERQSRLLWSSAQQSFLADQPGRFEAMEADEPDWSSNAGTLYWCESASDLLLFQAYERACGRRNFLLTDVGIALTGQPDHWVLLSPDVEFMSLTPAPAEA